MTETMPTVYDAEVLYASLDEAASRRCLHLAYMPMTEEYVLTSPLTCTIVGREKRLEKVLDILDQFPIVWALPDVEERQWADGVKEIHERASQD